MFDTYLTGKSYAARFEQEFEVNNMIAQNSEATEPEVGGDVFDAEEVLATEPETEELEVGGDVEDEVVVEEEAPVVVEPTSSGGCTSLWNCYLNYHSNTDEYETYPW